MRLIDSTIAEKRVVRAVFDAAQCASLRGAITEDAFRLASIAYPAGAKVDPGVRNNDRAELVSPELAGRIFARIVQWLPPVVHGRALVGLAPRLRFYRYRKGHRFAPHRDGVEMGPEGSSSLLTVLVALSRAELGGETHFLAARERIMLEEGDVLWFQHPLLHEGCSVEAGEKLLFRSDALYASA